MIDAPTEAEYHALAEEDDGQDLSDFDVDSDDDPTHDSAGRTWW